MSTLNHNIVKLQEPLPPFMESSRTKKGKDHSLEADRTHTELSTAELRKELEIQAKEMERKLLEKMKAYRGSDGFD